MSPNSNKPALDAATMASGHLHARREPRFELRFDIEVRGIGNDMQPFCVRTATADVSEWGCRFEMPINLEPDSIVTLQVFGTDGKPEANAPPVMFQVVRVWESKGGWQIAAWKMGPEKAWPVELPKAALDQDEEGVARSHRDEPAQK
jgi:PilZ domain